RDGPRPRLRDPQPRRRRDHGAQGPRARAGALACRRAGHRLSSRATGRRAHHLRRREQGPPLARLFAARADPGRPPPLRGLVSHAERRDPPAVTTAVVTGGAGFLGSHLCERLLAEGMRVLCVDNLVTGRRENIAHLEDDPRFRFLRHDISKPIEIDEKIDRILHFASPASPVDYLELPIQTLKVGSLGTHNSLGLARAHGARLLLASTSEVYGDPLVHP